MTKTITLMPQNPQLEEAKLVAAYARVSTGKDAMLHSLSSQVSYYSNLIQSHDEWMYIGVYSDEAITGTKDNRNGFQRMLADCRAGKVNMIITKSISRFARNTITLLKTVRELKSLNIDVFFEEQNIHTMTTEGELMLTILASYAQEESLSASENQKWRVRQAFENGDLLNWHFSFGYNIDKGKIFIDEETAPIVIEIFNRVINRESYGSISRDLNKRGVIGALGGKWCVQRIKDIISNEKYTGNALLQKHYRNNHLEKKKCMNTGELPKYYAEETHPAIINSDIFELAQVIVKKNAEIAKGRARPQKSEFTGKIKCPHCGRNYKRTISNGSHGWNCSTYLEQGKSFCHGKKIPESTLKTVCAEIIGTTQYNEGLFISIISHIEVPKPNELAFYFADGSVKNTTWKDRSRSESWTTEMKKTAAEKARQGRKNDGKSSNDNTSNKK